MSMNTEIYQDISVRTSGDIYIGVVGPVRAGKSTFIKRFMETQVIPNIDNVYRRERAKDELPQSGSGRMVMTAEPKFVPEEAVDIALDEGSSCSVRLIDCVGYMIPGATGQMEGESPRMVSTPWLDHEVPMSEAAELGTTRVIREHSTIGVVVTTDGSITEIPREDYIEAEGRVIRELQEIGKPFLVLLNAVEPESDRVQSMARDIASRYNVTCLPVNCLTLDDAAVGRILKAILYEFPLCELDLTIPAWVEALDAGHPIKSGLYQAIRERTESLRCIREVQPCVAALGACEGISDARITSIRLGTGIAAAELQLPRALFYQTLSEQSGFRVSDDGDLMSLLTVMKSLPLAYNKDMQEDKEPVFDALDTLSQCIPVFTAMVDTMTVLPENMRAAAGKGFLNATDCADYLAKKGMPFRDAYKVSGQLVYLCTQKGCTLEDLSLTELKRLSPLFAPDVYEAISLDTCVSQRKSYGGPAPEQTAMQIAAIEGFLAAYTK